MLTPVDIAFFESNGYVIVDGVVEPGFLAAAVDAICSFLDANLKDPVTWYRNAPENGDQVPLHHAQAFWDNRQQSKIYELYRDLWGTEELWVSMDRASFKPPNDARYPNHQSRRRIHWDRDPRDRTRRVIQGVLYLTDTPAGGGGFECVPSIYREIDEWLERQDGFDIFRIDVDPEVVVAVPGAAGRFIAWDSRLPHGGGANESRTPRIAQYIQLFPPWSLGDASARVADWRDGRVPKAFRGWAGQIEPEPWAPATLSTLGRKLLGLDSW